MDNRDSLRNAILLAMTQVRNKGKKPVPREEKTEALGDKLVRSLTHPMGPDQSPTDAEWKKGLLGK